MNFPFFSKKSVKDYYLGIFLKENQGVIMIFSKEATGLELIDREKFNFTNGWENLVEDVDETLYKLEKNLDFEMKKTIFFVYSHLVDDKIGDIKSVYLQKIKQLVKALEFQALGYIECYEAIGYYLEKTEQISLTSILIEIDQSRLGIFVYKGGKLDAKLNLARTDNIIADLTEGLKEIKQKTILPARIILYDSGDLDDTATKIISHRWSGDLFVQIPKVDIIAEDEVINGLMGIFGEQLKVVAPAKREEKTVDERRETFGFVLNGDVGKAAPISVEREQINQSESGPPKNILAELTAKFMAMFPKPSPKNYRANLSGKILPIIGIVIIVAVFFVNEYFFHKAELTLFLPTQVMEKTAKVDVNYRIASASADFTESAVTTGRQDVGDKARGAITIHNFDDNPKTFAKDSVLSSGDYKFTLDADVTVPAASLTSDGSAKLPGKNTGAVTATAIGPGSNLAANQRFVFDGLSATTFFAVNDTALSGGTKKQIQTVSKKDQDGLKALILQKSKNSIPDIQVLPGEVIATSLSKVDFSKLNFSKEIGEEASNLTLKATVSATQYLYDRKAFIDQALPLFQSDVQSGFQLDANNIAYSSDKITLIDNSMEINSDIKAKAVIKIDTNDIKKSLVGKNQTSLRNILKDQFKIEGYNLTIKEPLPFLKNVMPFFSSNITLTSSSL